MNVLLPHGARAMLSIWERLRGDGPLPQRDAMTADALQVWLGSLSIAELRQSLGSWRIYVDFEGSMVTRLVGSSFQGRYLDEAVPADAKDAAELPYLMAMQAGDPVFASVGRRGQSERHLRLVMPFADGEPDRVACFLVWFQRSEDAAGLALDPVYARGDLEVACHPIPRQLPRVA